MTGRAQRGGAEVERLFESARDADALGLLDAALAAPREEVRGATGADFHEFEEGFIAAVFALVEVTDGVARWRVDVTLHEDGPEGGEVVIEARAGGALVARASVEVIDGVATTVMNTPAAADTSWTVRVYGEEGDIPWSEWFDHADEDSS